MKPEKVIVTPYVPDAKVEYLNTGIRAEREGSLVSVWRGQLRIMQLSEVEAKQVAAALRLLDNAR